MTAFTSVITVVLTLLYLLLVIGHMMNRTPCVKFTSSLSPAKERDLLLRLIDEVSSLSEQSLVLRAKDLSRSIVLSPDAANLDSLLSIQPSYCFTAMDVYALRQLQAFFSKRENIPGITSDKKREALKTFRLGEEKCYETNRILRDPSDPLHKDRQRLISQMHAEIWKILGPCPSLEELDFDFGPGSSVGCKRNTSVKHKLTADATATDACKELFAPYIPNYHAWPSLNKGVKVVRGSNWTSVPKTFKTDRGINVEPLLNGYIQKGIGSYIRARLLKAGVDLSDQTANQLLAQLGSNIGDVPYGLSTIDLSMASDCISYLLVLDLLPWDWFSLLDAVRSPECLLPDGKWYTLEKFSAMGNGYTFELESLIFYALLRVICGDNQVTSVYGDDLICPNEYFEPVKGALSLIGFIPNDKKSFGSGPFRESCGADFWYGTNIRPLFLKKDLSWSEVFRTHNYFARKGWIDSSIVLKYVPSEIRLFGPDGYGDGHLVDFDYGKKYLVSYQCMCYQFKTYRAKTRVTNQQEGRYGAFLHGNRKSTDLMVSETIDQQRSSSPLYTVRKVRVPAASL